MLRFFFDLLLLWLLLLFVCVRSSTRVSNNEALVRFMSLLSLLEWQLARSALMSLQRRKSLKAGQRARA